MKYAIVSGGTGGHIYPGIAIAEELIGDDPKAKIVFVGSGEGLEKDIIPRQGFNIKIISARALQRKISYKAISAPFVSIIGFFQSIFFLRSFAPNALISTGGYVSLPVVFAALLLRIPVYIHEQNVLPGVTNRIYFKFAKKVFFSFEDSLKYFPAGVVVGNPVRKEILNAVRAKDKKRVVLIVGGSQGARTINNTVIGSLPKINGDDLKLVHIIGKRDFKDLTKEIDLKEYPFYQPVSYLYNMSEVLASADLVVSRAGATAIAEFLAKGLPMILVPFPFSAEGHQDLNADYITKNGAGIKINNADFGPETFLNILELEDKELNKMRSFANLIAKPDAANKIINWIINNS
ncbi:MAG: undecaprenyldiphospho-muramoylpentapeptide beta-N-acetylglucosaminyltransferase [Candidatus Margulisiibacteriota bacterium]